TAQPHFMAPEVSSNQVLAFRLVVSDGVNSSSPSTVEVTVLQVNRAPMVAVEALKTVDERTRVTLNVDASDPDGDALTLQWTQVSGPPVTLSGAETKEPWFDAPEVTADTSFAFAVRASDGSLTSDAATLSVIVRQLNNQAPLADAGDAVTADERGVVT